MNKFRKVICFISITMMILSLAACSSDSGKALGEGTNQTTENSSTDNTKKEQKLIVDLVAEPTSLDPAQTADYNSQRVTSEMYDRLVIFDNNGFSIIPSVAKKWDVSEDGLEYTFKIRDDVYFHDGTQMTIDDIIYSFERIVMKDHEAADTVTASAPFKKLIKSIDAVDDWTIKFTLNQKSAPFINYLASNIASIVNSDVLKEAVASGESTSLLDMGSGSYALNEWEKGVVVSLTRFDDYWGQKAVIKDVYLQPVTDPLVRATQLQTGEADIIVDVDPDTVATLEDAGMDVVKKASTHVWFLVLNTSKPPFNNVKVRQAVAYAIDRESIVNDVLNGAGMVANSPLSPAMTSYDKDLESYTYDPEKAKQLLAEAGYADGFDLEFLLPESGSGMQSPVQMSTAIQAYLSAIGINANMTTTEFGTFMDLCFNEDNRGENGIYDMWAMSWTNTSGDDGPGIRSIYGDNSPYYNSGFYENQRVFELINAAEIESDSDKRVEMYQEISKILHEESPNIFIDWGYTVIGYSPKLDGYVVHPDTKLRLSQISKSE